MAHIKNIIIIILFSIIYTQEYIDVVHLKNGDIIIGKIIENIINEHIRVELMGGSILTYSYDDIIRIDVENKTTQHIESQKPTTKTSDSSSELEVCYNAGFQKASTKDIGGTAVMSILAGLGGGLIGTGIAVALNSGTPSIKYSLLEEEMSPECKIAYANGYQTKLKSRKQGSALVGGLGGLILFLIGSSLPSTTIIF